MGLRRDIAQEFANFIPTQWTLLFGGWMFKPTSFWGDDSGEITFERCVSSSYQWKKELRRKELRRENNRCVMKMYRSSYRRKAVKRRKHCAQCGVEMDHSKSHNVRKFCDKPCYETYWSPDEVLKRM